MPETAQERSNRLKKYHADRRIEKAQKAALKESKKINVMEQVGDRTSGINHIEQEVIIKQEPQNNNYMETLEVSAPIARKVRGVVSIKPYVSGEPNMGLEKYGDALFPGSIQTDKVCCLPKNNIKTYITGLNEFSADIQSIKDQKVKTAKIKNIRETVAYLENTANANFTINKESCMDGYGTRDDKFWDKVTMFKSVCVDKNDERGDRIPTYWDNLELQLTNEGRILDMNDPHDLAIYCIIEAGGFGMVADSLQKAMTEGGYKFYLNKIEDVAAIKTQLMKIRNKAGGYLDHMMTTDVTKLFFMAILVAPTGSNVYKMGGETYTPQDQLYEDVGLFIEGKTQETNVRVALDTFLKFYDMELETMRVRASVKVAIELRLIALKGNGQLHYIKNSDTLGKTIEETVEHLMNPIYEETKNDLIKTISKHWAN